MTINVIFRHVDEDDDTVTVVTLRQGFVKLRVGGPTDFTYLEPADVVALHAALGAAIQERGWAPSPESEAPAQPEPAPESWVLMAGGYEDPVVVGVVGSQADADAAYSSTLGLMAHNPGRITVVGPFKQGHVLRYDDVYRP